MFPSSISSTFPFLFLPFSLSHFFFLFLFSFFYAPLTSKPFFLRIIS
nr:MAG TPA: hypothetical protein [Caudoviricetes sp.]